jgi:hypothetical protein
MRYRFLPFLLFQTRPKRNGVKTGHASCPPKFLDCASFREILRLYRARHRLSMPRSVLASCSLNKRLTNVFQLEYGPSSEAWTDPDSAVAAVAAPTAVAAVRAFAAIAASVAGASAPPAAGVFAALVPAARIPFPAAAGISGPASGCLCST